MTLKPIVKLTGTMARNIFATEMLTETIKSNETRNEKEHGEIWDELGEQDKRISYIEKRGGD